MWLKCVAKPNNSFSYTTPSTCYHKNSISSIPKGIALRPKKICGDDVTFDKRSSEYHNYLIVREYKPSAIKQQFSEVRTEARTKQEKQGKVSNVKFIATYNPALSNIIKIIQNNLSILRTHEEMKKLFLSNSVTTIYRREKNFKEILSRSLFPPKFNKDESFISNSNKCDICRKYLIFDNKFKCKFTGTVYRVRDSLYCNNPDVVYIISCKNCGDQFVGSATDLKARFRIDKSGIKRKKDRCITARHFKNKFCDSSNPHIFLKAQLMEFVQSDINLEDKLWEREKYW